MISFFLFHFHFLYAPLKRVEGSSTIIQFIYVHLRICLLQELVVRGASPPPRFYVPDNISFVLTIDITCVSKKYTCKRSTRLNWWPYYILYKSIFKCIFCFTCIFCHKALIQDLSIFCHKPMIQDLYWPFLMINTNLSVNISPIELGFLWCFQNIFPGNVVKILTRPLFVPALSPLKDYLYLGYLDRRYSTTLNDNDQRHM